MSHRIVSPCRVLLAVLISLAGFGLARAADKNEKYASEKPTIQKSVLQPSLTGKLDAAGSGPCHRPGGPTASGRRKGSGVAAGRRRRISSPRLPRPGRPHSPRRQGGRVPGQHRPRQAGQAHRRTARQRRLRQAHGRRLEGSARQTRNSDNRFVQLRPTGGVAGEELQREQALGPDGPRTADRRRAAGRERRRHRTSWPTAPWTR